MSYLFKIHYPEEKPQTIKAETMNILDHTAMFYDEAVRMCGVATGFMFIERKEEKSASE